MKLFLSNFTNKLDKKGRVSVPSQFRSSLGDEEFFGVIIYKSFVNNCIDACSLSKINKTYKLIDQLDPYSAERDALMTIVMGSSVQLSFDKEGRILMPSDIIAEYQLSAEVTFVGKGENFEIWNPSEFIEHKKKSLELAKLNRNLLTGKKHDV